MPVSEFIKPISGKHSIKEAAITIFLANAVTNPSAYKNLLDNQFKGVFNKFEMLDQITVRFDPGEESKFDRFPNAGFKFSNIENDRVQTVLQCRNEPERSFFSFHTLDYDRWTPFLESFIKTISTIGDIHGEILAKAYSLHYVDQFVWIGDSPIDFKTIFNENSGLLPKEFFSSVNKNYSWLKEKKAEDLEYFDRLEINTDNSKTPLISISHNAIRRLDDILNISELIKRAEFSTLLNHAHSYNKETLGDLLKSDVKTLIKLTSHES